MPSVSATVEVSAPAPVVYQYLHDRYDREAYRSASLATKGYLPAITRIHADGSRHLMYQVPGRDPILRIFISGWTWSYDIEPSGGGARVTIRHTWSWLMSLLAAGTARHQAANEIVETAMALDALTWNRA